MVLLWAGAFLNITGLTRGSIRSIHVPGTWCLLYYFRSWHTCRMASLEWYGLSSIGGQTVGWEDGKCCAAAAAAAAAVAFAPLLLLLLHQYQQQLFQRQQEDLYI